MSQQEESFNPEYNPLGAEGSIDTNAMPWISVKDVKGLFRSEEHTSELQSHS